MLYEDQAANYDERASIPEDAAIAVAAAIHGIVGLEDRRRVLEIGVGTGLITLPMLRYSIEYVGFDCSPAMLGVFEKKVAEAGLRAELHVADGNDRWPVDDHSVDVVFCARALHHLDADHIVDELERVLTIVGGWLVVGKVIRPKESPKSRLRRKMRRLLESQGKPGRSHLRHTDDVFDLLEERGAQRLPYVTAARWTIEHRPIDSIAAWESKEGLGGIEVRPDVKQRVLDGVRAWAIEQYGSLDVVLEQEEIFELYPMSIGNE